MEEEDIIEEETPSGGSGSVEEDIIEEEIIWEYDGKPIWLSGSGDWDGVIGYSVTQDEIRNCSVIELKLYVRSTVSSSVSGSSNSFCCAVTVNSKTKYIYFNSFTKLPRYVGSCTHEVEHDLYGNATAEIEAILTSTYGNYKDKKLSGIKTVELDPMSHSSASSVYAGSGTAQMGKNLLLTITRVNSAFYHELRYTFGGETKTITTNAGGSYTWAIPDLAALCNNEISGNCSILCLTYDGDGNYRGYSATEIVLKVPDPTIPSIEGGEVTLGSECSIACPRNSENFTVILELEFKSETISIASGGIDSQNWTPSYDFAKLIPTLTSGTGTLKCTTMNGTAEVGSKTATIRVIVPENEVTRPAFTAEGLVLTPITSLSEELAGVYIRGKTGLLASITAESHYSTIQNYVVTVGGVSAEGNPASIDLLVNEGDTRVTAKVTDARGFSTTVTTSIHILPYRSPKVTPYSGYTEVICERAMETGELSSNGTYLAIKAGKSFSSVVVDGVEKNSCSLRYRWKPNGADAYSDWITLLADGSTETEISLLVGNVVSSLQTSYLVQMEALDALGSKHTLTFQIMTAAISFVLYDGPDGAGFGKYPEEPHVVDIASHMTLLVRGKLVVSGSSWVDLGLADGISESVYSHGRKEDTGCHYLVSNGNHVYAAFNCGFAYAGTAMVINATPIPEEYRPARQVASLCAVNDRGLALVSVNSDGYIRVEWVQKLTDTVNTGSTEVIWIDGYLDYWT